MHANVEYLSCGEVEALGYFQLSDMRYDQRNMVTEWVSATLLQLYLIGRPAHFLNTLYGSRGRSKTLTAPKSTTKTFILEVVMVLDTSLWKLLGLLENRIYLFFSNVIWISDKPDNQ